jgi:NADPH-dependent glutamate synthase beta subunit-like oxidoreductase
VAALRQVELTYKRIESKGVVQAMTFLTQQTKSLYGEEFLIKYWQLERIIVIGGGDTGLWNLTDREQNQLPNLRSCLNHLLDEAKLHLGLTGHCN